MRTLMVVLFLAFSFRFPFRTTAQDKVQATSDNSLRPVFESRYAAMKSAMAARDGKAISEMLAPDFVSEDASGQKQNADAMIQGVIALPKDPLKVSNTTILSVKVNEASATVDQRYDMKTTKTGPDGDKRDVELISVSTDTWIKSQDAWLLQRTVTNQMDYSVNGKLLVHKVHP
jgi:ketosteroid isomerase-like protein